MVKDWVNEDGYREKGYRERKLAEIEAKRKTKVTKDMNERDIMKVWDESSGYTDEKWRAECEAKAKQQADERIRERELEMMNATKKTYEHMQEYYKAMGTFDEPSAANTKQVGGDHYKNMGVEPWDVVDTWPIEQRIGAYRHGVLKYLMRMGSKDENVQEIKKAGHYIEKLVETLEERDNG